MKQYLDLLSKVLNEGVEHPNRTGVATRRIIGAMLEFNMADGFPAMTTKKLYFNSVKGELLGFIRGYSNAQDFRNLGCNIWDANANENADWRNNRNRAGTDDLGRIYGVQWRSWFGHDGKLHDQLESVVDQIDRGSNSRRLIVNAWNPAELDKMALPPCHILHQYHVDNERGMLSMTMYQRSCDLFLGVPFNIASYALLLHLVAEATGLIADKLVMFLADVHIYENHLDQVAEQLSRKPMKLPDLMIGSRLNPIQVGPMGFLTGLEPGDIELENYNHHRAIQAPMAV